MVVVAVSAFWINYIRSWGPFSPLHLLSVVTLTSLMTGIGALRVMADRRRAVALHRQTMTTLYASALVIPGAFTLLPGRLLGRTLFPADWPWLNYAVMGVMIAAGVTILLRVRRAPAPRGAAGTSG